MSDEIASTVRELGERLGLSKSSAHRLSEHLGPAPWSIEFARRVLEEKRRPKAKAGVVVAPAAAHAAPAPPLPAAPIPAPAPPVPAAPAAAAPSPNPLISAAQPAPGDEEDRAILERAADPLEVARAAVRLASRKLARADGPALVVALESLKVALQELRMCEGDYLDLARERGELIERDVAKATMGQLARRFVLALERLEVRVAAQVELWRTDATFSGLATEERARVVREWVTRQTREARLGESSAAALEEIERMVAAEIADRKESAT